jgi:glycosyltransferase involved in cell wall biosynthesis
MKILISAPSLDTKKNVSGISTVVNNILSNSTTAFYIHFLVGNEDGQKRGVIWILRQFYLPFLLVHNLYKYDIEIFHLNAPLDKLSVVRDFVFLHIAKLLRVKVLLHLHGGEFMGCISRNRLISWMISTSLKNSDHIVTLSKMEKDWLLSNYHLDGRNITPLLNSIPIPEKITIRERSKVRVIFIGRIVERKGIFVISQALKKLYKIRSDFEFFLYGTGPDESNFISEMRVSMHNDFYFKGVVSGRLKIEAYSEADIFLLPSFYGEGLPMSLLEAMSFSTIPIVTADGSMLAVVKDGINGFIVKKNDALDLFEKLNNAIDIIKCNNNNISSNARRTIKDGYDIKLYIEKLECIYEAL